jgi:hypothetical protein
LKSRLDTGICGDDKWVRFVIFIFLRIQTCPTGEKPTDPSSKPQVSDSSRSVLELGISLDLGRSCRVEAFGAGGGFLDLSQVSRAQSCSIEPKKLFFSDAPATPAQSSRHSHLGAKLFFSFSPNACRLITENVEEA